MITPDFKLSQEEEVVIVAIRVPYVKISSCEVEVEKNRFTFYLKPYFLKLQFAQDLKEGEDGVLSSVYDHNTYIVKFKIKKLEVGQHFENLDLVSKLFEKKPKRTKKKADITVINSTQNEGDQGGEEIGENGQGISSEYGLGFDRSFEDFFENHEEELHELADLDPSSTPIPERIKALFMVEALKFDPDHYLCNFFENKEIKDLISAPLSLPIKGKKVLLGDIQQDNIK